MALFFDDIGNEDTTSQSILYIASNYSSNTELIEQPKTVDKPSRKIDKQKDNLRQIQEEARKRHRKKMR